MARNEACGYIALMPIGLQILVVAGGGAVGALLRWGINLAMVRLAGPGFPWGTFTANLIGCFAIGLCAGWILDHPHQSEHELFRLGLMTGLIGALTTFSTFSIETISLIEGNRPVAAGLNIVISVLLGLFAAWLGMQITRSLV